jgi:hypothetical protein
MVDEDNPFQHSRVTVLNVMLHDFKQMKVAIEGARKDGLTTIDQLEDFIKRMERATDTELRVELNKLLRRA